MMRQSSVGCGLTKHLLSSMGRNSCFRLVITLALAVFATSSAHASVFDISASERGWVCSPSGCLAGLATNNGASPNNNYLAGTGSGGFVFRDWFEFAIPTLTGGALVSATLNLYEPAFNGTTGGHTGGSLTYAVYGLSSQPITFSDVTASNPFGQVSTSTAMNGTTVSITLTAAALTAIAGDQTGNLFIGGIDSGENGGAGVDFLLTSKGVDPNSASTLHLVTAPSSVPEPSSALLFASGLLVVGWRFSSRIRKHARQAWSRSPNL